MFGSSHIDRFRQWMLTDNKSWFLQNHEIRLHGVSGGTLSSLFVNLVNIVTFQPDILFLQIGSNDIGHVHTNVVHVLFEFEYALQILMSLGIRKIFIGLVFYRERVASWRGLTLQQYNERVYELNAGLMEIGYRYQERVLFWRHRGFLCPNMDILLQDGVHLNSEGNKRLYYSLRGAFVYAEKWLLN